MAEYLLFLYNNSTCVPCGQNTLQVQSLKKTTWVTLNTHTIWNHFIWNVNLLHEYAAPQNIYKKNVHFGWLDSVHRPLQVDFTHSMRDFFFSTLTDTINSKPRHTLSSVINLKSLYGITRQGKPVISYNVWTTILRQSITISPKKKKACTLNEGPSWSHCQYVETDTELFEVGSTLEDFKFRRGCEAYYDSLWGVTPLNLLPEPHPPMVLIYLIL